MIPRLTWIYQPEPSLSTAYADFQCQIRDTLQTLDDLNDVLIELGGYQKAPYNEFLAPLALKALLDHVGISEKLAKCLSGSDDLKLNNYDFSISVVCDCIETKRSDANLGSCQLKVDLRQKIL